MTMSSNLTLRVGDKDYAAQVRKLGPEQYEVVLNGETKMVLDAVQLGAQRWLVRDGVNVHELVIAEKNGQIDIFGPNRQLHLEWLDERQLLREARSDGRNGGAATTTERVRAPMPGRITKCLVQVGQVVQPGQGVIVVEAMKMENELRASIAGKVASIAVTEGQNVEARAELLVIEHDVAS